MFLITLAAVLASNGPICQKFCDVNTHQEQLKQCIAEREYTTDTVDHVLNGMASLATRLVNCEKQLKVCKDKVCAVKKPVIKKKAVVVIKKEEAKSCGCPTCCSQPAPVVNVTVVNNQAQAQVMSTEVSLWSRPRPNWLLGVRGAGGIAFCAPQGIGLVGLRVNYLPIHLGVDVYTEFWSGTGAQLLVYPIQSRIAMWHINGGAIWFNQRPFLLPNLPRQVDLTLGTGLELRVLPFLWVTADLVVRMPNPIAIADNGEQFSTVLGNSLVQTQGILGLMLRTW